MTNKYLSIAMECFRDKICRNVAPYATAPKGKAFALVNSAFKADADQKFIETKLLPVFY